MKNMLTQFLCAEKADCKWQYYKEVTKRLTARVHNVSPEFQESGSWCLLHDNVPAHSSGAISGFLAKRGTAVLTTLLPWLAPEELYFLSWKLRWKGWDARLFRRSNGRWRENWRRYRMKHFLGHLIRSVSDANFVRKWAGAILSNSINKYCLSFSSDFYIHSSVYDWSHCVYTQFLRVQTTVYYSWDYCVTLYIAVVFWNNTTFRKLDLFPSSYGMVWMHLTQLGLLKRDISVTGPVTLAICSCVGHS
jgi:hypothetical protein